MAQRFVGQPGGKTAFDKRHSDDSLAPAAQLQRRETSKRLVSWEEGNNQLALLDSDYKAAHCRRYGLAYFEQAVADGFEAGARHRRTRRKRRRAR